MSNMRQISAAMLQYIIDNKGWFPPIQVAGTAGSTYPKGWWWANELTLQHYISAPNLYDSSNNKTITPTSPFFCPAATFDTNAPNGSTNPGGNFPTDGLNGFPNLGVTYTLDSGQKFNIPTWYQPWGGAAGVSMQNNRPVFAVPPQGGQHYTPSPFLWFNKSDDIALKDSVNYGRNLSQIRKAAEFVMLVEGGSNNVQNPGPGTPPAGAGPVQHLCPRIAARHGKRTPDGLNAFTNFAFFDGHAESEPSVNYDHDGEGYGPCTPGPGEPDYAFDGYVQGTIGFLNLQRP
jgi:prepilin-type processing-associated H-X9-DG protein